MVTDTSKSLRFQKTQMFSQMIDQKEHKNNRYKFEPATWCYKHHSKLEVEERIEERHEPPRYENPPDVLPNPNNESFNRSVRFKPIRISREGSSASQHHQHANRHRSMVKTNGSLGQEGEDSSDEGTMNQGSSPSSSILAYKLEEPPHTG